MRIIKQGPIARQKRFDMINGNRRRQKTKEKDKLKWKQQNVRRTASTTLQVHVVMRQFASLGDIFLKLNKKQSVLEKQVSPSVVF